MHVHTFAHWTPCSDHAYEDFFWPRRHQSIELSVFRVAIADGTSTTSYSGMWARQLVLSFVSRRLQLTIGSEALRPLQDRWLLKARARLGGRSLPWYVETKLKEGAASTLLALELQADESHTDSCVWRALAVGDSCLVHLRQDTVLESFPLTRAEDFTNHPPLISTRGHKLDRMDIRRADGEAIAGDSFYLMTDALAKWFFKEAECGEKPWEILQGFDDYPEELAFAEWVDGLRGSEIMDDDDVTVVRLHLSK